MISVSSDYKNYISSSLSVSAKNKIIVDGVEYLGNVLKTYPKISHSTSKICGSFPAKTVSFEIYDLNNSLDFEGKEIEVYKGLMLNGTPYYIKQGVFIPQKNNITTNISDRSIKFEKVQDRTQFLDDVYESELDWSNNQTHTGLEIVQEICTKKNLTLKSSLFAWSSYNFNQPNFPSNITYRQVLARLAEIGGETVIFDYNGLLEFKSQYTTGDTIIRSRYGKITKEKAITYNSVVLGKKGINDDIKYPSDMLDSNRISLRIEDNPFVDLYRDSMIEDVANFIIGLTYVPFTIDNLMDGFIYELNDVIDIIDRNNETLRAVILSMDNNSRITSNIKLDTSEKDTTDYNLAGSSKQELAKVRFDVDHINNQISSLVTKTEQLEGSIEVLSPSIDSSILIISTDENGIPYNTKTYNIAHSCKLLGNPISITPTTSDIHTGITCNITSSNISFVVNNSTAITSSENKYTFTWTYTDSESGNVFTENRVIMVNIIANEVEENVVIGSVAPSDTTLIWFDTTENKLKSYVNGSWQVIDDYSDEIAILTNKVDSNNTAINGKTEYVSTGDTTFVDNKDYYELVVSNYVLYTGERTGNPSELKLYEQSVTKGLNQKYIDMSIELDTKLSESEVREVSQTISNETITEKAYTKQQIKQIVSGTSVDGVVVSAVISTEGTFDKDGMHYNKTGAKTESTINQNGLEVDNKENSNISLYAGYVPKGDTKFNNTPIDKYRDNSVVYTNNLISDGFTEVGVYGRFQEYPGPNNENGVGFFLI